MKREKTDHAFAIACAIAASGRRPTRALVALEAECSEATAQRALERWRVAQHDTVPAPPTIVVPLPPEPDPSSIPEKSRPSLAKAKEILQRRFDARVKQQEKEFNGRVYAAAQAKIIEGERAFIELYGERLRKADAVRNAWRGVVDAETYMLVLRCLHPDNTASQNVRADAFRWWREHKHTLVKAETPVQTTVPTTFAEALARRAAARTKPKGSSK